MTQTSYPTVIMCPFCGSEGCTMSHFDHLVNAWVTDFSCDEDVTHHCLIVRLPPTTVIELKVIPHEEAKKLIEDYITDNRGVWTSDIAFNLGLDVGLVLGILRELTQEGSIHPTEITEEN